MSDTVPVLAQIPPASLSWMDHVRQMEADAESRRQERIAERAASQADHRAAEEARRDERRHPRRNRREISAENGQAVISAGRMVASDLPIQGELDDITEEVETAWRKLVASKSLARTTALAMEIQRLMVQASDVMRRHESAINNTASRREDHPQLGTRPADRVAPKSRQQKPSSGTDLRPRRGRNGYRGISMGHGAAGSAAQDHH
ncbi:MAG: hypothetical protein UU85_C0006G0028 [Candidatus Wolfebacteria bacterium GW2011_GWA2_42_10]|uniref:Uncharacterized protein n=1 Tax=Candidatus Wolfebacteria bacterium GW2011_GWA2_42_10 TaxID=1619004 RepID=A0A0G0XJS0_9BACT|nr:MAG: hypothetical protein UU85_C0006G0028 [Candidatus Wolfebacteria bacterium GW2011_GWA2_42_10]